MWRIWIVLAFALHARNTFYLNKNFNADTSALATDWDDNDENGDIGAEDEYENGNVNEDDDSENDNDYDDYA